LSAVKSTVRVSAGSGTIEDPATGGASGPVGAYLVRHGLPRPGRFTLEQGYELGRPSQVEVEIATAYGAVSRVLVGGGIVRMAEGELLVLSAGRRLSPAVTHAPLGHHNGRK
jgi:PhzF family phenazine biosynthesis protein